MHGSLFLCKTASGIRFMRQQIAGTTPTRLRSFHTASGMRSHVTIPRFPKSISELMGFHTASGMRSHVTPSTSMSKCLLRRFNTASGMRSHVTYSRYCRRRVLSRFNTASGMRSHVTRGWQRFLLSLSESFNTASGMRSHVTLCLGGRRNRRLKCDFPFPVMQHDFASSSNPSIHFHRAFYHWRNIPSHFSRNLPQLFEC